MLKPAAATSLKKLAALKPGIDGYAESGEKKDLLHSAGKSFLRGLAQELGMPKGSFEVRSNLGGNAVSGEVTLHGDQIYVQLSESCVGKGGVNVLYRNCTGRKDYSGGTNNFIDVQKLEEGALPGFVARCKTLMESAPAPRLGARP